MVLSQLWGHCWSCTGRTPPARGHRRYTYCKYYFQRTHILQILHSMLHSCLSSWLVCTTSKAFNFSTPAGRATLQLTGRYISLAGIQVNSEIFPAARGHSNLPLPLRPAASVSPCPCPPQPPAARSLNFNRDLDDSRRLAGAYLAAAAPWPRAAPSNGLLTGAQRRPA
jgi:hypothetical protein